MAENPQKKQTFVSIQTTLLVSFTVVFGLVFAVAFYWFSTFAEKMAMNRLAEDLQVIIEGTAAQVDGDSFEALAKEGQVRADGYTDDPRYWEHVKWLHQVQLVDNRLGLYTYIKGPQTNEVIFIGSDGALVEPPNGALFKESFIPEYRPDTIIGGLTETTLLLDIYTDEWGSWISGYTPIRNSKGEIVGGLGADYRADYVLSVREAIRESVLVAFGITYGAIILLVLLLARRLSGPIIHLTKAAERIGEGDYDQDLAVMHKGRFTNEIAKLAEVFEIMIGKVEHREQTLRKQVETLKIEIDEVKRQRQVTEIVDTEFFQDLQQRADQMRLRRKKE